MRILERNQREFFLERENLNLCGGMCVYMCGGVRVCICVCVQVWCNMCVFVVVCVCTCVVECGYIYGVVRARVVVVVCVCVRGVVVCVFNY